MLEDEKVADDEGGAEDKDNEDNDSEIEVTENKSPADIEMKDEVK